MPEIREERPDDIEAIRRVNTEAFGQGEEARIVDAIRSNCPDLLSLVAVSDGRIVGHVLLSPVVIGEGSRAVRGMGLAPMAVLPEQQRRGIGSALVEAAVARLKAGRCPFVIVLGHAEYYPRFGFQPASRRGIRSQWEVPDEAFLILVLDEPQMANVSGTARYRPEFADAT